MKLPEQLKLRSICESWQIKYHYAAYQKRVTKKQLSPSYQLVIKGSFDDAISCADVLQKWLKQKAKRHFEPWLRALSEDCNLPFAGLTIRGQKSRWGSCSSKKMINLNYKLLFLPAQLVEYVFLHELCHTKQLDHSPQFWNLLSTFDLQYKKKRKLLRDAPQQHIPHLFNL